MHRFGEEHPYPPGMEPGKRLLPVVIDHCAEKNPDRVWASMPRYDDDMSRGFRDITYREFADAINRAAWWLCAVLGKSDGRYETFAYNGPKDLRYPVLAVAAIKVGKKFLLTTPTLPLKARIHLLDSTGCRTYLCAESTAHVVKELHAEWPVFRQVTIPSLSEWFSKGETKPYLYNKTFSDAKDDPIMIFHTSGTTGLPKPIVYTNQMMTVFDAGHFLPDPNEELLHHYFANSRVFCPLPAVHVIKMFMVLQLTVFWNMTLVTGAPSGMTTTPEMADKVLQFGDVSGVLYPSSLYEDITQVAPMFERIKKLRFAAFAGAPLDKRTGDLISQHTNLIPIIGSTEVGLFTNFVLDSANWNYYRFHSMMGYEFEHHSGSLYELVLNRKPELARWQQVFHMYPGLERFHTQDLFVKHPTELDAWAFAGRTDEVIMLSSGRLHAAEMETEIQRHPNIRTALVGGEGRKKPFLIVEMTSRVLEIKQRRKLIDHIWPMVQRANETSGEPVRLSKSLIIIASPDKPLIRSTNGMVLRRETIDLYKKEIDSIYKEFWARSREFEKLTTKVSWATQGLRRVISGSDLRH